MGAKKSPVKSQKPLPGFQTKGYLTQEGWTTVSTLLNQGVSIRETARRCGVDPATVCYWKKRNYCPATSPMRNREGTVEGDSPKKRRQRMVKSLTRATDSRGLRRRNSCNAVRKALIERGIGVSIKTVHHDLKAIGLKCYRRGKGPRLTPEKHERRVKFAMRERGTLHNIWFSDEKIFNCNDHQHTQWAEDIDEVVPRATEKFSVGLHVWGVVGVGYRQLVFLPEGTVNADGYKDTVKRFMLRQYKTKLKTVPSLRFMQDGASAHTASLSQLREWGVNMLEGWPATSPDLNPIENVWSLMSHRVSNEVCKTRDDLVRAVEDAWFAIPDRVIDNLVLSFKRRLEKCVEVNGKKVQK